MSVLTILLCFCMVSPLLSLKCHQSAPGTTASECVADDNNFELCVTITETMSDGTIQVKKGCKPSGTSGCSTTTFCKDKDFCNTDTSDFSVAASVTSRSCKCGFPTGLSGKALKSPLAKVVKDESECDSKGECTVTADPGETVVCLWETNPLYSGQTLKTCDHMNITEWTVFPSRQTTCACDTDLCNNAVVSTTPVVLTTTTTQHTDKSTATASVSKSSNTPPANVTATVTSSAAALCEISVLYGIVLAVAGNLFLLVQ